MDQLLTARDVAKLLNVSVGWVHDHSKESYPRLKVIKLGKGQKALLRFQLADVLEFIEQNKRKTDKAPYKLLK
jgi:hypothetical protein